MTSRQFSYEESKGKLLYNSNVMQENKGNQNQVLFDTISLLIHRKTRSTTQILANRFVDFFYNKIEAIRSDLFPRQTPATNPFMDTQACNAKLAEFESMTEDQVN